MTETHSRLAVVTGGTRGLGSAMCQDLAAHGSRVVAIYQGNTDTANTFHQQTGIPIYRCDVAHQESVEEIFARIANDHGSIDILVNNAGITRDRMLHRMTDDDWHNVIATNLNSLFYTTKPVIPTMRSNKFGRIINISSVNARTGQMGQTNYVTTKSGVMGFTRSLALETARYGITVNCVAPGYTETDMVRAVPENLLKQIVDRIPVGRLGQAHEIARAVTFLSREDASFITGATLDINGGQYMG